MDLLAASTHKTLQVCFAPLHSCFFCPVAGLSQLYGQSCDGPSLLPEKHIGLFSRTILNSLVLFISRKCAETSQGLCGCESRKEHIHLWQALLPMLHPGQPNPEDFDHAVRVSQALRVFFSATKERGTSS